MYQNAVYWVNLKSAQTHSNAIILDSSVPADCLEKAEHTKIQEILFAKVHLSPRLPRKMNLTSAWQVQHEGGTEKPVAVGRTLEPKIDFRIQGIPHEEVEQD